MTAPAPIVGIVSHRDRVLVATTEGVYELIGNKLHRLEFSEEPPAPMYPTSWRYRTDLPVCDECKAPPGAHLGTCSRNPVGLAS